VTTLFPDVFLLANFCASSGGVRTEAENCSQLAH